MFALSTSRTHRKATPRMKRLVNCPKRKGGKTNFQPFLLKDLILPVLSVWFSASCVSPGLFMLK